MSEEKTCDSCEKRVKCVLPQLLIVELDSMFSGDPLAALAYLKDCQEELEQKNNDIGHEILLYNYGVQHYKKEAAALVSRN